MKYAKRGVSSDKKEVHDAIKNIDKGLFPDAFCKILADDLTADNDYALIMHADTAGTKTALAYLYWKECGDISVWDGIVQDAIVMNLDDMACAGAVGNYFLSSTIGRNKNLISGDVIKRIIEAGQNFACKMSDLGVELIMAGGETADVGDIVRSIDVGFTAFSRLRREDVVRIKPEHGNVIVGFESCGQATYEEDYNSGIGSNGLTFARHEMLSKEYAAKFPETYDPLIDEQYVYSGKMKLSDPSRVDGKNIGQLLLSPTRTYLPLLIEILKEFRNNINGIVHCTGGGQTKVLHFIDKLHVVKNNLMDIPPVFNHIQEQSNADFYELFKVFNMGQRLEVYTDEKTANKIIDIAALFQIKAQICGYFENSPQKKMSIFHDENTYLYS